MIDAFSGADLSKSFKFNLSDFGVEEVQETKPFDPFSSALPPTPMPESTSNTNSSGSGSRDHESGVDPY
jgi:hypothetical protein